MVSFYKKIESIVSLNLYLLYVLINIDDDVIDCEIVDCTMAIAKEKCPKTCTEPDVCKMADCTKSKSLEKCPMKCSGSSKEDTG